MDLANITFVGLMTVGVVNVLTFFWPDMKAQVKFGISVAAAFGLTFVPADLGNLILERAKVALEVALASSGAYKLTQKIGGQ
jgi:hypothetical protein